MSKVKEFWKKHKKLMILLIILLLIVAAVLYVRKKVSEATETLNSMMNQGTVETIEKRALIESLSATGTVVSVDQSDVSAKVSGVEVLEVKVSVGDSVKAGDVLCILDSENLEMSKENAEITLDVTEQKTDANIAIAGRGLSESQELRNIQVERDCIDAADAWEDYEKALADVDTAKREYDSANEMYLYRKSEYENLLNDYNSTVGNNGIAAEDSARNDEINFEKYKERLSRYIDSLDLTSRDFNWTMLAIANVELEYLDIGDTDNAFFVSQNAKNLTDEQKWGINDYLTSLVNVHNHYMGGSYIDGTSYMTSQSTSLKAKMDSAKAEMEGKKSTYDARVTTADSKLTAYNNIVRGYEDHLRNNDSTIMSRNDSLKNARLDSQTASLNTEQQIKQFEDQIEACTVVAPIDGVVTAVNVSEGNLYNGSTIATIEDESSYEVAAQIDEYDIAKIKEGQRVIIKTNGTGELELEGVVKEIAPRSTKQTGANGVATSVNYKVLISIITPCDALKMDMTAKISIIIDEKDDIIAVPYDAVQTDEDGQFYIEIVEDSATPDDGKKKAVLLEDNKKRIYVTKGIESDFYIEVIGDEVKEGLNVYVPPASGGKDFLTLMMEQGAMGGF